MWPPHDYRGLKSNCRLEFKSAVLSFVKSYCSLNRQTVIIYIESISYKYGFQYLPKRKNYRKIIFLSLNWPFSACLRHIVQYPKLYGQKRRVNCHYYFAWRCDLYSLTDKRSHPY